MQIHIPMLLKMDDIIALIVLGAVHKRRSQSGEKGVVVQCRHFADKEEGVLQMRTSALFGAKNLDFSKFLLCSHEQEGRGLSQCGYFADKEGGGQFFAILCGRLFWTAPYSKCVCSLKSFVANYVCLVWFGKISCLKIFYTKFFFLQERRFVFFGMCFAVAENCFADSTLRTTDLDERLLWLSEYN